MSKKIDIEREVAALRKTPEEIARKARAIHAAVLQESRHIRAANFDAISSEDVERLYRLYDESFFDGLLRRLVEREPDALLHFGVSNRMTRAGGKTTVARRRVAAPEGVRVVTLYQVSVSALLLFQTFREEQRSILVAGLTCADRLDALQRIMEHELIHLLEFLVWRQSRCAGERFQQIARNLFGHTAVQHDLVTPREIAGRQFGIRQGDRVIFEFDGARHTGIVNRISQRATVLVERPDGQLYSDGKHYLKFYVPLPLLRRVEE